MSRFRIGLLALVLLAAPAAQAAQRLILVTEEYPPYNMTDGAGKIVGVSTGIVSALMAEVGYAYDIQMVPWARAIVMASSHPDTCVFSMSRTPEREATYKWIGPLVYNDWTLFAREGTAKPLRIEDVGKASIGTYQGDAIVAYLEARGFNLDVASSDDLNPKKLMHARIDYWATGRLIGEYRLRQQGIRGIVPVLNFNRTEMYLACHKSLPDDEVQRLNRALVGMHKRGQVGKIYAEYGYTP